MSQQAVLAQPGQERPANAAAEMGKISAEITPAALAAEVNRALPPGVVVTRKKPGMITAPADYTLKGQKDLTEHRSSFGSFGSTNLYGGVALVNAYIEAIKSRQPAGGRLYVVMGQMHPMSAHIHLLAAVLSAQPGAMLAYELPYNSLANYVRAYNLRTSPEQRYSLHEQDPDGHGFARAVMARNDYPLAPLAVSYLFQAAVLGNHRVALVDMASKGDYIDPQDPLFADIDSAREESRESTRPGLIPYDSSSCDLTGVNIRNEAMARRAKAAARYLPVEQSVIIATGYCHLGNKNARGGFGGVIGSLAFEDALPACLTRHIGTYDMVLTVFPASRKHTPENVVPEGSHPQIIPLYLRGLSGRRHRQRDSLEEQERFTERLRRSFTIAGQPVPMWLRPFEAPDPQEVKAELQALLDRAP